MIYTYSVLTFVHTWNACSFSLCSFKDVARNKHSRDSVTDVSMIQKMLFSIITKVWSMLQNVQLQIQPLEFYDILILDINSQ